MDAVSRYQFPTTLTHQRRFCGLPMDEVVVYLPLIGCAIFVNMWIFAPAISPQPLLDFVVLNKAKERVKLSVGAGVLVFTDLDYAFFYHCFTREFQTVLDSVRREHGLSTA
ncbi:hypothetical protein ARAF_3010 [Arsenophonus endosymbiont of Aleurodicus floccissimus]|uniref:hypothetical protein n=1 Tax=Arsenophonus endosymbiont of Aleurodicus floccissimus TaxID=2152761 RepID=UPI000E6B19ED|nr:hypothetical protein [Arsenophonus endosymbiont of Aleurodicus floccissimus]SPP32643.1 hypothetical protein ARAF_3010 [Arsenophonus endosymbiont of Aleurodicus floccissimus]